MKFGHRLLSLQKRTLFVAVLALAVATSISVGGWQSKTSAADCDDNSIIHCGFTSSSNFIGTVRQNVSGNGHNDLQAIYAYYGLQPTDYDKFISYAKLGTDNRDGTVVVDGQVVATNANSIGRLKSSQGSGPFTQSIPNAGTFYGNVNSQAFKSTTASIPVMVFFNSQGVMQFAVLTSCGNPVGATKVTPTYSCDVIHKSAVAGKTNTYSFTAQGSANRNATIKGYTYNFGDGSPTVFEASGTTPVQHTYTTPGNYKATVTVTVNLPGSQTATATSAPCATTITVLAPYYSCVLAGATLDKAKYSYSFTVTATYGNGATLSSADFNFGDGKTTTGLTPNGSSTTITTNHTYAAAGNYTTTATLHFSVGGAVQNAKCTASVTPTQPPVSECKPGIPVGSALCTTTTVTPCQYNSAIPASDTEHCVPPPTTLVNTGAGDVIAIFAAAVVAGFIIFRQFIYKKKVTATNDAAAASLGHHMLNGAQQPDHSEEMVQHLTQANHHQATRPHPNAASALHHPTYHRSNRFRPGSHDKPKE